LTKIRAEEPRDIDAIRRVNELAFRRPEEARIIDDLRAAGKAVLSLVAVDDTTDEIVGHVLFSPMSVKPAPPSFRALALGPLAVLPDRQHRGIGSLLARTGVAQCLREGADAIFLEGSLTYYKRFGFEPVAGRGVTNSQPFVSLSHLQVIEGWEGAVGATPITADFAEEFALSPPGPP
jgi:putative acetyltransferase